MSAASIPKKLAIFGGTFDPIHNAHLNLAHWVSRELELDRIVFIPNYQHPFQKRKNITDPAHRLEMLKIATHNYPKFRLETFEIEQKKISYTIDTLNFLKQKYPGSNLYFLMGADNIPNFDKWKEPQQILSLCTVAVYSRELNNDIQDERFHYLKNPLFNVSSTDIRERIATGRNCDELVPAEVLNYIIQHKIYPST